MNKRAGFTLIEVVMAMALVGVLLTGIVGIATPVKQSIQTVQQRALAQDQLNGVLDRLADDLNFALKPVGLEENPFTGTDHKLVFYAMNSLRFAGKEKIPGPRKIVYQYQKTDGILEWAQVPLLSKDQKETFFVLGEGFQKLRFYFLGAQGWIPQWDKQEWPMGIKITGTLVSEKGEEIEFERSFYPIT